VSLPILEKVSVSFENLSRGIGFALPAVALDRTPKETGLEVRMGKAIKYPP